MGFSRTRYRLTRRCSTWQDITKIVFHRTAYNENSELWTVALDGQGLTRITTSELDERNPDWSPDGTQIAFSYLTNAWVMNADGSARADIGGGGGQSLLAWSPSGSKVAFTQSGDVWAMNADGTGRVNLTNHAADDSSPDWTATEAPPAIQMVSVSSGGAQANSGALKPAISNDGRYVAFHSRSTNLGPSQNTNTSTFIFLHDTLIGLTEHVTVTAGGDKANGGSGGASVNADGSKVTFWTDASNFIPPDANGTWDIFIRDRSVPDDVPPRK